MARAKCVVPTISEDERVEVTMPYPSGNTYHISYNPATAMRSLWRTTAKGFELLDTSPTPVALYDRVSGDEKKIK